MKIVAELGSNFTDFQSMKNAVHLAASAGADAIKFQYFSEHDMFGNGSIEYNFPGEWIPILVRECERKDIEFMCTIFNHELVEIFNDFIKTWKVASSDMCYRDLLIEMNKTGKPVYLSTGAHTLAEINKAVSLLKDCSVTVFHCVAAYPANNINVKDLISLTQGLTSYNQMGLSDHSIDLYTVPSAFSGFCSVLEKHFNPHDLTTPDSPHSLSFDDFRSMVQNIRGEYNPSIGPKRNEKDMLWKHNRRMVAIKHIEAGDTLRMWDNYGPYRTRENDVLGTHAFSNLDGQVAEKSYAVGMGVWK